MQITAPIPAAVRRVLRPRGQLWPSLVLFTLATAALVGASVLGYQRFLAPAPAPPGQVVPVHRGSVATTVSATGSVVATKRANLVFGTGGRLKELNVAVGDEVKAGQVLAKLSAEALEVRLEQAKSQLASAKLKLKQLAEGASPEDVAAAQAAYDAAVAKYEQLQSGPSSADLRVAEATVASAQASYDQAIARLETLESGATEAELAAAQAAVEGARNTLASAEARLEQLRAGPTPEELIAAQSAVDQARANVQAAEAKLAQVRAGSSISADVASAQSSLASAQSALVAARNALAAKEDALAQATADLEAQQAALEVSKRKEEETCREEGDSSTACKEALAATDKIYPSLRAAEASVRQLSGDSAPEMKAARESLAAAQAAYEAAKAKYEQVKATSAVPADLISAQTSYENALGGLASAEAKLRTVQQGPSRADLVAAETAVQTARANLASAETKLAATGVTTPLDLDAARSAVSSAEAGLESARAKLAQLRAGATKADLESARSAVTSAQATLVLKSGARESDLALQMEAVRQAELGVRQAQIELDNATLVAPFDGVVALISANVGEQVSAGGTTGFLTLVDPREVRVDVTVDETDLAKVQLGKLAEITFEALSGKVFTGKVTAIAPHGTTSQGVVTYPVSLSIDTRPTAPRLPGQGMFSGQGGVRGQGQPETPADGTEPGRRVFQGQGQDGGPRQERGPQGAQPPMVLPAGLTASVTITIDQKDDVLVVPNRAVQRQGRERVVEVLGSDGKSQARPVQVGVSNDQLTEIVDGLSEGDQVVIPATTTRAPNIGGGGVGGPGRGPVFVGPAP